MKKRNAFNIVALTVFIAAFMSIGTTIAGKVASVSSKNASATVATMNTSAWLPEDESDYVYDMEATSDDGEIIIALSSGGTEVATTSDIILTLSEAIDLTIYCYNEDLELVYASTEDNAVYIIEDAYGFSAGEDETVYLTVYCTPADNCDVDFTMDVSVIFEQRG